MAIRSVNTEIHEHTHTVHGIKNLVLAQNRDVHILAIKRLVHGEGINQEIFPEDVRTFARNYFKQKKELLFLNSNGVLCVKYPASQRPLHEQPCMIVMPQLYQHEILFRALDAMGHQGISKVVARIQEHHTCPGIRRTVGEYVSQCLTCQQVRDKPGDVRFHLKNIQSGYFNELVQYDHMQICPTDDGNTGILVIIDHFSKFAEAIPCSHDEYDAITTSRLLLQRWFARHGTPTRMQSDNAPNPTAEVSSTSATRNRAPSPIPGLSPVSDEELVRKRASPHELAQSVGNNDSPTSRPPPDKRNNVLRSVVIQEPPKVGYHGMSEPQMTMKEVMERYAPSSASVPESTDNSVHSSSSAAKSGKKFTGPPYFPQSDNVSGSVVTRDANRIWQVARKLNDRQYRDRQRVPPTNTHQAQLRKLSVIVHVTRTLRPFDADTGEAAWEQRVIRRLTTTHDNYLRPMQINLHEQCKARYSLRPGETWETHSQYPRGLKAMKSMSLEAILRTRYCVMVDSTVPCDLPLDNIIPDALVVTMPLSRLPEMVEVAIALFSPEGPQSELSPSRIVFANLMDHMACEGLLENLPHLLREMLNNETARN